MLFINPLNFYIMDFQSVGVAKAVYVFEGGKWVCKESSNMDFTPEQFKSFVSNETISYFRRLGSKQSVKHAQTSYGRQVVALTSTSPDETEKHAYNFRFKP